MQLTTTTTGLPTQNLNKTYRGIVDDFNDWLGGRKISPETIREYLERDSSNSMATIALKKQALKKAIQMRMGVNAKVSDLAQLDFIFKEIKVGRIDSKIAYSKVLSQEEIDKVLENSTHRNRLLIRFLSETGARIAEVLNARLDDCTVEMDYVFIKIVGKGRKERTIFIQRSLFDEINAEFQGDVYLFESASHRRLDPANVWFSIKKAGQAIGRHVHPHMFRHSFATNTLLIKKKSLKAISNYLGHSTTSITADMYVHDSLMPADLFAGTAI